jgi:hypothetical protein
LFDRVLKEPVLFWRVIHGDEPKISMVIIGFKSVKNVTGAVRVLIGAEAGAVKRDEHHKFTVLPGRWLGVQLAGWKSSAVFGKNVNARCITRCK